MLEDFISSQNGIEEDTELESLLSENSKLKYQLEILSNVSLKLGFFLFLLKLVFYLFFYYLFNL